LRIFFEYRSYNSDKGVNFAIQKGLQISRSTVRWYEHNDMDDLEAVLQEIHEEQTRLRKPLTRRFIVTEGLSENYGDIVDLPRIVSSFLTTLMKIELKKKYKYRLILDESWSFGVLGRHGKGVTEYYGVSPSDINMIIGSMSTTLCGGGGFCAGSKEVVDHQVS
jgi:serine palmitoyltransferase